MARPGSRMATRGYVHGLWAMPDVPVYDHRYAEEFAGLRHARLGAPTTARCPTACMPCVGWLLGSTRDDRPSYVPPLYHQPSFVRAPRHSPHLLRTGCSLRPRDAAPGRRPLQLGTSNKDYFSKTGLPWKTVFDITCNPKIPSFLEDAAAGTLRQVSSISPAFWPSSTRSASRSTRTCPPATNMKRPGSRCTSTTRWSPARSRSPRCWSSSTTKQRLLRSRPPPRREQPPVFGSRIRCKRSSSRRGSNRAVSHTVFDHTSIIKNDPVPLLPRPTSSRSQQRGRARLGLSPRYPSLRVARADHLRGAARPTTRDTAPSRDALVRRKHPGRDAPTAKGRAPTRHAIDSPRVGACRAGRDGCLMVTAGTGSARVPGR